MGAKFPLIPIIVCIGLYMCLIAESHATPIDVTVPNVSGTAGSQVTAQINVSDTTGAGIIAADIKLTFDPLILTAFDASIEGAIAAEWMMSYSITGNQITIAMISLDELVGSGTLVKVNFRVSDGLNVGEKSPLTLSQVSFNDGSIPVNKINGQFTVISSGALVITVSEPNGGEKIKGGILYSLLWTLEQPPIDHIHLMYSADGGDTYQDIVNGIANTGSYGWTTPLIDSSEVRIKAIVENSSGDALASDESDGDFTIDSTPPETTTSLFGTPGQNGWYTSSVEVELSATDNLSGIEWTKYRINTGNWQIYSGRFAVTGSHIYYQSEDEPGNLENERSLEILIDKTPPSQPVVIDDGDCTADGSSLNAFWEVHDPESDVARSRYAIGTTPGGDDVVGWTEVEFTHAFVSDLNLTPGETYYFAVQSKNKAGSWSSVGISDGIVYQPPQIQVTPASLTFNAVEEASNPGDQSLIISNAGCGGFDWSISDDAYWLFFTPTAGYLSDQEVHEAAVSVDITGLAEGSYQATLTIESNAALGSPYSLPVILNVLDIPRRSLIIQAYSPVDLIVADPMGRQISKTGTTIPSADYTEADLNGDGSADDRVTIPDALMGGYSIAVIPEPGAQTTDTYTLDVSYSEGFVRLAQDVQIQNIPPQPYVFFFPQREMYTGWNFISVPVQFPNSSPEQVFQSISGHYKSIWMYNSTSSEWKTYTADRSSSSLDTISPGIGYLVEMTSDALLSLPAYSRVVYDPITLAQGWNFAGYNDLAIRTTQNALSSITGRYNSVWTYDALENKWKKRLTGQLGVLSDLEIMAPGAAYWMDIIAGCTWSISFP